MYSMGSSFVPSPKYMVTGVGDRLGTRAGCTVGVVSALMVGFILAFGRCIKGRSTGIGYGGCSVFLCW